MLKPLVHKFCPDLSVHLKDITEKRVPAKLKPIEDDVRNKQPRATLSPPMQECRN